jgi:hypothetical protein
MAWALHNLVSSLIFLIASGGTSMFGLSKETIGIGGEHLRIWIGVTCAWVLIGGMGAQAQTFTPMVDLSTASTTTAGGGSDTVRGFAFTANALFTVTRLGWYDGGPAGLSMAHEVGIYDGSGTLIASGTVASGTVAPLVDGFRWVEVTPVLLSPGQTYVVAGTDPNPGGDVFEFQASGVTYDARLSYVENRWVSSSTLTLPTNNTASFEDAFFGPNLGADAVPFGSAVDLTGSTSTGAGGGSDAVRGFAFDLNEPIAITQFGWFDDGPVGLAKSHDVAIFDESGSIVVQATVPSGTVASLSDGFRWVTIPHTTLHPGQTYVIAGTDPSGGGDQFRFQASSVTYDPRIDFVQNRWISGSTLTLPTNNTASFEDAFFGPNFQLMPVQIPATPEWMLVVAAVLLMAFGLARMRTTSRHEA